MDFKNLTIIGERINPGFKSSKKLFDDSDIPGIQALAVSQVAAGAKYLNVNIGERALTDFKFMRDVVTSLQEVVDVPLSFDFPNREVQEVCLKAYDVKKSKGALPLINSISELRYDMLSLYKEYDFRVILMASERMEKGERVANKTAQEVYMTAKRMVEYITTTTNNKITNDDIFIDVSVCPIAADTEGLIRMGVDSIKLIGQDPKLKGVHMSVGLSNISIMVPATALNGSPLKLYLESAFLSNTVPYGLDTIIGTAGRDYKNLSEDDFVMKGFNDAMSCEGFDSIIRIQQLYME